MRIKHWAGYGCIEGKKISTSRRNGKRYATIELSGNHEQGLMPRYFDFRDWERWLGKRFHLENIAYIYAGDEFYDKNDIEHLQVVFEMEG